MRTRYLAKIAALVLIVMVVVQLGPRPAQAHHGSIESAPRAPAEAQSSTVDTPVLLNQASAPAPARVASATAPTAGCLVYAVDQQRGNDSQLFTIDLRSNTISALGAVLADYNIEGLKIHPITQVLYATSGDLSPQPGHLYVVDSQTGALTSIGSTGFDDVEGLAFRPTDATLWGWVERVGLIEIDTTTGAGTLVFSAPRDIEGLAWSNDGTWLYGVEGEDLWVYDPADNALKKLATTLPKDTETIEMRPDGMLMGSVNVDDAIRLFVYDLTRQRSTLSKPILSAYDEIEGLAWLASCGNPSAGGEAKLIKKVSIDKREVCAGEEIFIAVQTKHPENPQGAVDIYINGRWGSSQYLHFTGAPGTRLIQIVAATPEKYSDRKQISVTVNACDPSSEHLEVTSRLNPFHDHGIDFEVANAATFAGQNPVYAWDFGDGQTIETIVPYADHFYGDALARDQLYSNFQVTLTLRRSGQVDLATHMTVTLWNLYALSKQRGFIQPPVAADPRLLISGTRYVGTYTIRNLEDSQLLFTARQLEYQFCDPQRTSTPQASEGIHIELGAHQSVAQEISIPANAITADICGVALSLEGQTVQGTPVYTSVSFDLKQNPVMTHAVTDPDLRQLLNQIVAQNLVPDPLHVTEEDLYRLAREGKITLPSTSTSATTSTDTIAALSTATNIRPASGEDIIGQICAVGDPSPRPGVICQPSGEWTLAPPRIANTYKGDILLTSGCNETGALLSQVSPPQPYNHAGMIVEDYYRVRHSLAIGKRMYAPEYLEGIAPGTDGIRSDVLRYGWPGAITQSIDEAFNGAYMADPESGTLYQVGGFFPKQAVECYGIQLPPPIVVKPVPGAPAAVRERLHAAADAAMSINGHYRFYAYSYGAAAGDRGYDAPLDAGWASGSLATMCSSFLWQALKSVGVNLEGPFLEDADYRFGANRDGATLDGLYLYTKAERLATAYWLHTEVYNRVYDIAGWLGEQLFGAASDAANQVTNCFSADACAEKDDELWKNPGVGRTVSPSDILFWDSPAQGGVYGFFQKIEYRGAHYIQLSHWTASADNGAVTGRVFFQGQPMASVGVRIAGIELVTDGQGVFRDTLIPPGRYEVVASTTIVPPGTTGSVPLEARAQVAISTGATASVDLILQQLPDYNRLVTIIGNMFIVDDESCPPFSCDDETGNFQINETRALDPFNTRRQDIAIDNCVGGETHVELDIHLQLAEDNRSIHLTGEARLYEGGDCGSDDREDSASFDMNIPPGTSVSINMDLKNGGTGGGDTTDIDFLVANGR